MSFTFKEAYLIVKEFILISAITIQDMFPSHILAILEPVFMTLHPNVHEVYSWYWSFNEDKYSKTYPLHLKRRILTV